MFSKKHPHVFYTENIAMLFQKHVRVFVENRTMFLKGLFLLLSFGFVSCCR